MLENSYHRKLDVNKSDSVNFNSPALFLLDALSASDETGGTILMDIVPQFPFRPLLMMDRLNPKISP